MPQGTIKHYDTATHIGVLLLDALLQVVAMAPLSEHFQWAPRQGYVRAVLPTLARERRPLRVPPMHDFGVAASCVRPRSLSRPEENNSPRSIVIAAPPAATPSARPAAVAPRPEPDWDGR